MQNALKILINSFYGYFGFRNSRDYLFQIPDCITTSCRFITKKTMVESRRIELIPIWGDTDSCYFAKMDGSEIDIKTVNGFYLIFLRIGLSNLELLLSLKRSTLLLMKL
jgi:DNA polymerase I